MEENFYDILNHIIEFYGKISIENFEDRRNGSIYEYEKNNIRISKNYPLDGSRSIIKIEQRYSDEDYWREAKITPELQNKIIDNIYKPLIEIENKKKQEEMLKEKKYQRMRKAANDSMHIFNIITFLGSYEDNKIKVEEILDKFYTKDSGDTTYVKERRITLKRNNIIVYSIDSNGCYANTYHEGEWEKYLISVYQKYLDYAKLIDEYDYNIRKSKEPRKMLIKRFETEEFSHLNKSDDI